MENGSSVCCVCLIVETETSSVVQRSLPIMTSRKLTHMPVGVRPQQAWIETLSSVEDEKLGIIDLHPDIFGLPPRFDTSCLLTCSLFVFVVSIIMSTQ